MLFLTILLFLVLTYLFPLNQLIYAHVSDWPITPVVLRRSYATTGVNMPFWIFMFSFLGLLYLLVKGVLPFVETMDRGPEVAKKLNSLLARRGVGKPHSLGLLLIPIVLSIGLMYGIISQQVLLLGVLCLTALIASTNARPPLPLSLPVSTIPLVGVSSQAPERPTIKDGTVRKRYTWTFQRSPYLPDSEPEQFTIELDISEERYQGYKAEPREFDNLNWGKYALEYCPEVAALAARLGEMHVRRQYCTFTQASSVLSFAQSCIEYSLDVSTDGEEIEYPRYPIETLMEGKGDCEDRVILSAALLKQMGFNVALLFSPGHVSLGVGGAKGLPGTYVEDPRTGEHYLYGETSPSGWRLGEVPEAVQSHLSSGSLVILPVVKEVEAVHSHG